MTEAKHLRVEGRVQGVGYRYEMQARARELGVSGWVRNRHDCWVEAVVSGNANQLEQIIDWARKGPRLAAVTRVIISETQMPDGEGFFILPTDN
jgi:acylphosphatase